VWLAIAATLFLFTTNIWKAQNAATITKNGGAMIIRAAINAAQMIATHVAGTVAVSVLVPGRP
jgi:hypothetical protein